MEEMLPPKLTKNLFFSKILKKVLKNSIKPKEDAMKKKKQKKRGL